MFPSSVNTLPTPKSTGLALTTAPVLVPVPVPDGSPVAVDDDAVIVVSDSEDESDSVGLVA